MGEATLFGKEDEYPIGKEQKERIEKLKILNQYAQKGQILFTGSSLMEQFPVNEILMTKGCSYHIYNRGVSGFTTTDMLRYMDTMVFDLEPSKIFINIGTNDIGAADYVEERLLDNYSEILMQMKQRLPQTKIYVMAYYPVNETDKVSECEQGEDAFINRNNRNIQKANQKLAQLARKMELQYIDVNDGLRDEKGKLKKEYTVEGIHMYANAYYVIFQNMEQYICL